MGENYLSSVKWDLTLCDLETVGSNAITRHAGIASLVTHAIKVTNGAPANTPGRFIPAARVLNAVSGINYENTGSTASPNFQPMATGASGISALTGDVTAAGPGSAAATIASNVITNSMINSAAGIAYSKLATLTSAQILVGSAGNVATSVAMSGNATISNTGAVAVTGLTIPSQAAGDILYFNGTNWVRLPIGTAAQVLTVNGGGTAPEWA